MRKRVVTLAIAGALTVVCGAIPAAYAASVTGTTTRVQVVADEWRLSPSRSKIKPGKTRIEVVNMGEDDHDLRVARAGGGYRYDSDVIAPGERIELSFTAKRGTYKLWCSLADHKAKGMTSKIQVRN